MARTVPVKGSPEEKTINLSDLNPMVSEVEVATWEAQIKRTAALDGVLSLVSDEHLNLFLKPAAQNETHWNQTDILIGRARFGGPDRKGELLAMSEMETSELTDYINRVIEQNNPEGVAV